MGYRKFSYREQLFGVKCWFCGKRVRERKKVHNHHIDGNKKNNVRSNQEWTCTPCHKKASKIQQKGRPKKTVTKSIAESSHAPVCAKKEAVESSQTESLKREVNYDEGTRSMQVNDRCETAWRNYALALIKRDGKALKKDVIYGGSEAVGCNPSTAYRYYGKLVSISGPCVETKDEFGNKIVVLRRVSQDLLLGGEL
jgi:hypothetical protein|tara:strand:+ start:1120 stop:1710 length:591 start_codon:yes stop_codon:yes gene_type:complete